MSKEIGYGGPLDIDGYLLAWSTERNHPQLITLDGEKWLPIFAKLSDLYRCMAEMKVESYTVKQIDDGMEFLRSISENPGIRVCTNLHRENGKLRFKWLKLPSEES